MLNLVLTEGIGFNFMVINPKDGHRGDNSIWFGTCDRCGAIVKNSKLYGTWQHTTEITDVDSNILMYKDIEYCPDETK